MLAAVVLLLVAAAGLAACGSSASAPAPLGFVTRAGAGFVADGKPFRFVGVNVYDAASTDRYSCDPKNRLDDKALRSTFRYLHDKAGVTVVRFWAYQTYTDGGRDFSGVDRVLAAARANRIRVIPVMEDGPGDCTVGTPGQSKLEYQGDTWYTQGYRQTAPGARLSYRDYVRLVVAHYADNPAVLGWMLVNEAETNARDSAGRSALVGFAADMAGVVKAADHRHLLTVGTQANGAPGASGPDFAAVYGVPGIDFAEVHDWGHYGSDTEPMPGASDGLPAPGSSECASRTARIACSFATARDELHMPLVVGEAGIAATDDASRARRARLLQAKAQAAFAAGASGYLVWQVNQANTDSYGVLPTTHDPLFGVLAKLAPG